MKRKIPWYDIRLMRVNQVSFTLTCVLADHGPLKTYVRFIFYLKTGVELQGRSNV